MNDKDFKTKNLVFDKYVILNNDYFDFNSELKLLIEKGNISLEDALNIIFDLMYGVLNYDYDEREVREEFESLIEKVKDYNINEEFNIKNSILFYKDYSHVMELFQQFSFDLKFDLKFKADIEKIFNDVDFKNSNDLENNDEKNSLNNDDSYEREDMNSISLEIRENIELDKQIRILSSKLRKQYPRNWREYLKASPIYKKRHGLEIDENGDQNEQIEVIQNHDDKSKDSNLNNGLKNDSQNELSEKEIRKIKVRSRYLSNKIKYSIKHYSMFIKKINNFMNGIEEELWEDSLRQAVPKIEDKYQKLLHYQELCDNSEAHNKISAGITDSDAYLKDIEKQFDENLKKIILSEYKIVDEKFIKTEELSSRLNDMVNNSRDFSSNVAKEYFLNNLENIDIQLKQQLNLLEVLGNRLNYWYFEYSSDDYMVNVGNDFLIGMIDEIDGIDTESLENIIIEQERVYENLKEANNKVYSIDVDKALDNFDKCFNRQLFIKRLIKKYNLQENELDKIKNEIIEDIVDQKIPDENVDFKRIIENKCKEFRKNNTQFNENDIDSLLDNVEFSDVDNQIVEECRNKVKIDLKEGNITLNQVELKLTNYVNKKVNEIDQLHELELIKNDPNVPSIKIHLSPVEINKIYEITENEILSEYGIRGDVENRVYYLINQQIRENQSEARGRLNTIKREVFNTLELNKEEQKEFIHQIEFLINNNEIKYYSISEDYIIDLSNDFITYGQIKLR